MKKFILAAALIAGTTAAASAADMRMPTKAPVMAAPVYSWTGFYIGLNAGYAWGDSDAVSSFTCLTGEGCGYVLKLEEMRLCFDLSNAEVT